MTSGSYTSNKQEFYVLDCSIGDSDGPFCFCPARFDDDGNLTEIVTGLNYISTEPPDRPEAYFIGVVHQDGQDAVDAWCADHEPLLNELFERRGKKP